MTRTLALLAAASALCATAARADGPPAKPKGALDVVEEVWPSHPEWFAMLVDIAQGSQLGPNDGWFRKAVARTRHDWKATARKLDGDGDGRIERKEFPGPDEDFARLDRDRDEALTPADFDFAAHALAPSPGAMLFSRADRDGDGKVTREELEGFFAKADAGGLGFLALDDLKAAIPMPSQGPPPSAPKGAKPAPQAQGPTKLTLLKGLYRQEIGSLQAGPKVGDLAPDFTLKTVDGSKEVTLSKLVGEKPVVLVFGNFTCGPFRNQAGNVEKLHRKYKDRAEFVMVYVREAHPNDGWSMESNNRMGVDLRQPRTYEERVGVAQACSKRLDLGMPMLVDTIDDAVGARYSGMPSRLYLIDREGRVAAKSGRGPFGFKTAELEHSLLLHLNDSAAGVAEKAD